MNPWDFPPSSLNMCLKHEFFCLSINSFYNLLGDWQYFQPIVQKWFPLLGKEAVRGSGLGEVVGYSTNPLLTKDRPRFLGKEGISGDRK